MSAFRVEIETDGAAFDGEHGSCGGTSGHEVGRILRELAVYVENNGAWPGGCMTATIRDINGNRVGFATFSEEE